MSDIIELSSDSSHPPSSPIRVQSECVLTNDLYQPGSSQLDPFADFHGRLSVSPPVVDLGDDHTSPPRIVSPSTSGRKIHDMSDSESDKDNDDAYFPDHSIFNYVPLSEELPSSQSDLASNEVSEPSTQSSSQTSPTKKRGRSKLSQEEREKVRLEKEMAKEKRLKAREEKQKEKQLRDKEKEERRTAVFKLRRLRPGECTKYMSIIVDSTLYKTVLFEKCVDEFPLQDVNIICRDQPFENTILWERREDDGSTREEGVVAIMYDAEKVVELIKTASLIESLKQVSACYPGKQVLLWIFTLSLYFRKSKNAQYRNLRQDPGDEGTGVTGKRKAKEYLTREEIEMGLTELQILAGISYRSFKTFNDLSNLLYQFTKSIAETPFKLERQKLDQRMSWYNRGESRNCIRVDKDMNGLSRLWVSHLAQFSNTNVETVNSITSVYPTPQALMQAYDKCSTLKEKDKLLQELQVVRNSSASAVTRKLGPQLSHRVCNMYTSTDGSLMLSQ